MKSATILRFCIHLMLFCVTGVHTISMYKSCMDVLNDKGQNATDGEYVVFLENKVGISIYCHGKFHSIKLLIESFLGLLNDQKANT